MSVLREQVGQPYRGGMEGAASMVDPGVTESFQWVWKKWGSDQGTGKCEPWSTLPEGRESWDRSWELQRITGQCQTLKKLKVQRRKPAGAAAQFSSKHWRGYLTELATPTDAGPQKRMGKETRGRTLQKRFGEEGREMQVATGHDTMRLSQVGILTCHPPPSFGSS